jgi:hypothetical protein
MFKSPRMNDGRSIMPQDNLNQQIREYYNINSNWDYRKLLQKQGLEIINSNFKISQQEGNLYFNPSNTSDTYKSPYIFSSVHQIPKSSSDLQKSYLSNQSYQARLVAPSIPTKNN